MNKRIIIHVGLAKTGTTFLQNEIFPKLPINYTRDIILTKINVNNEINLISNEGLSISIPHYVPFHTDRIVILDYIKNLFPNAEIMIGMRELNDSLINSYYSQFLRNGGVLKKKVYIERFGRFFTDYKDYLNAIEDKFDSVFIYRYGDFKRGLHKVICKICDFIEVDEPAYENKIVHSSYKPYQQETKRKLNYLCKSFYHKKGIIPIGLLNKTLEDLRDG